MNFEEFDKMVDTKELAKQVEDAKENGTGDYPEITDGTYTCTLDNLELGATKDNRPMVKAQFRIKDGKFHNCCLFKNAVVYGTKNDANAIASTIGWLKTLEPSDDINVVFESYSQLADLCMDIAEDVDGLEYEVEYTKDSYNNIKITDVFE